MARVQLTGGTADLDTGVFTNTEGRQKLTTKERDLLAFLVARPGEVVTLEGETFRLERDGKPIDHPLNAAALQALKPPALIWWAETWLGGELRSRSPYAVLLRTP